MNNKLYNKIDIWEKINDKTLKIYRCFELLDEGVYYVQSADFIDYPFDEGALKLLDEQIVELFLENLPDSRIKGYPTLKSAIEQFQLDFS